MLFQTYYYIDPNGFEPPIGCFQPAQLDLDHKMFSFFMRYKHAADESDEPVIVIHTLHRCEEIPDDARDVFTAEVVPRPSNNPRHDGLDMYPSSYRDFVLRLHASMDRMATEVFNVVRWRLGVVGGPLGLDSDWASMRWHDERVGTRITDEHGFLNRQIPAGVFTFRIPESQNLVISGMCKDDVEELCRNGARQPLHQDLFREAWQRLQSNARSALIMAIAAAETGLKTTIVELNPSSEWIIENLQSPPLVRMLREYLGQLQTRLKIHGEVRRPPDSVITTIRKGVELRNMLVHGRETQVDSEVTREVLEAVRDLLYLLDYYRGYAWALERISANVKSDLTNPWY